MMTYEENMEAKEKMYEQIDNADSYIQADVWIGILKQLGPVMGALLFVPVSIILIVRQMLRHGKMNQATTERKIIEQEEERKSKETWDGIMERTNDNKLKLREALMAEQEMTKEDWKDKNSAFAPTLDGFTELDKGHIDELCSILVKPDEKRNGWLLGTLRWYLALPDAEREEALKELKMRKVFLSNIKTLNGITFEEFKGQVNKDNGGK